jgi:hypothetical protein
LHKEFHFTFHQLNIKIAKKNNKKYGVWWKKNEKEIRNKKAAKQM